MFLIQGIPFKSIKQRFITPMIAIAFLSSCAPTPEVSAPSSVSIKLPASDRVLRAQNRQTLNASNKRKLQNTAGSSMFGGAELTIIDDIDCYTVAIAHKGQGTCQGDGTFPNLEFISHTVADGGEIVLEEIPTQVSLEFHVIGFSKGQEDFCPDFLHLSSQNISNIGQPRIVGSVRKTLEPIEENTVDITIAQENSKYINSCGGHPFNWEAGGFFGTARFGQSRFAP